MVIKQSTSTPIQANEHSTIWDYPMPDENTGVSYQKLNGRLPAKGCYRNKVCQEIMFIVAGYAQLNINDKEYSVSQGDVVVLQPGEKHFGQYQNTVLITITSPNWSEEQCEVVE